MQDPSSPAALARIPLLLVPLGNVRSTTWTKWSKLLTSFSVINQTDVPLENSFKRSRFFPSLTSPLGPAIKNNIGNDLHLSWTVVSSDPASLDARVGSTEALSTAVLASQPLALIAVCDLEEGCTEGLASAMALMQAKTAELFPDEGFPLVARCFGVEREDREAPVEIDGDAGGIGAHSGGITVIPKMEDPTNLVGAILGEVIGGLLGELADMASILDSSHGLAFLQQSILPPISILPRLGPASPFPRSPSSHHNSLPPPPASGSPARAPSPLSSSLNGHSMPRPTSVPPNGLPLNPPLRTSTMPVSPSLTNLSKMTSTSSHPHPGLTRSVTGANLRSLSGSPSPIDVGVTTSLGGPGRKRIVSAGVSPGSAGAGPIGAGGSLANGLAGAQSRLAAVMASMYLLSGRLGDAIASYTEAIALFGKQPAETIWHALALEGLATALFLVETKSRATTSAQSSKTVLAEIFAHLELAHSLYHRSVSPLYLSSSYDVDPLPSLYAWCALRQARLAHAVLHSGELSPRALHLSLAPPSSFSTFDDRPRPPLTGSGPSKSDVCRLAGKAHGPWLVLMPPRERLGALGVLAATMRSLGMRRREGLFAREMLACVLDLILDSRIHGRALFDGSAAAAAALPVERGADVGVRLAEGAAGNQGVMRALRRVLEGYGVDLEDGIIETEPEAARDVGPRTAEDSRERFGWPELQLRALRDAIATSEVLPEHSSVVFFALTALRKLYPFITPAEQHHLSVVLPRALAIARRRGDLPSDARLKFWSGWLVLSLEIGLSPASHVPIEHSIKDRTASTTLSPAGLVRDPFLYNPRLKTSSEAKAVVVQNEPLEYFITLQNPFGMDLEIQNIRLSTSGVEFVSNPCSATLAAASFSTVRLTGFAPYAGTLVVQGCVVRLPDGSEATFLLPLHDEKEEKRERKRSSQVIEQDRALKLAGLDALPSERRKRQLMAVAPRKEGQGDEDHPAVSPAKSVGYLSCEVVPEQSLLRIRGTSLTHGALMLYDGEESTIRITLENTSHLPVDFVTLSFQDSTIGPSQAAIAEGDLSPGEAYELESDLIQRPVFSWDEKSGSALVIPPGGRRTFVVRCLGKVGCTHGTIVINYAYLDRPGLPRSSTLHTRQIAFPILITVYHTLECSSMDVLRLVPPAVEPTSLPSVEEESEASEPALVDETEEDSCLLAVDVRNVYGQPFEVTFRRMPSSKDEAPVSTTRLIPPGSTERIVLPLHRMLLAPSHVSKPIPSLTERQFVVSKLNASYREDSILRNLFWYREALLSLVDATWCEPGSSRTGKLSLRTARLTEPMLDVLRADEVGITLRTRTPTHSSGTPSIRKDAFFDVEVSIRNRLPEPITPLVHLAPLSLSPVHQSWATPPPDLSLPRPPLHVDSSSHLDPQSHHFLHSGLLSAPLPLSRTLQPGARASVKFRLAVLAEGRVELRVAVEDVSGATGGSGRRRRRNRALPDEKASKAETTRSSQEDGEARIWFSEVLEIQVAESEA